jgi:hypothetical protein
LGGNVQKPPSSHLINEDVAVRGYLIIAVAAPVVVVILHFIPLL